VIPVGFFPFGQPVLEITQTDRTPKDIFVLGVYASAVHARWVNKDGEEMVKALAVASEPEIFWRGWEVEAVAIIERINIPEEAGRLVPASGMFNGPSGRALDERILEPLGLGRGQAWLCDLVPHSCANPGQLRAIKRAYESAAERYGLPAATVPEVPKQLTDERRREAILNEIDQSKAGVLILLGDMPLQWFLRYYDEHWGRLRLADFRQEGLYGRLVEAQVGRRRMLVLPLAHPRQVGKLGQSAAAWYDAHETWIAQVAGEVGQAIKAG
jgi:uracil-DNA glycosylase